MVRPRWETARISPARSKTTLRKESLANWRAMATGMGPMLVDLAQLACFGMPPLQGLEVHPDHHRAGRGAVDEGEGSSEGRSSPGPVSVPASASRCSSVSVVGGSWSGRPVDGVLGVGGRGARASGREPARIAGPGAAGATGAASRLEVGPGVGVARVMRAKKASARTAPSGSPLPRRRRPSGGAQAGGHHPQLGEDLRPPVGGVGAPVAKGPLGVGPRREVARRPGSGGGVAMGSAPAAVARDRRHRSRMSPKAASAAPGQQFGLPLGGEHPGPGQLGDLGGREPPRPQGVLGAGQRPSRRPLNKVFWASPVDTPSTWPSISAALR